MAEYHYSQLPPPMQRLYRMVERACRGRAGSVQLPGLYGEQGLTALAAAVEQDHPELYYVDFRHLPFTVGPGGRAFIYHIRYTVHSAMAGGLCRQIEDRAGQALAHSGVRDGEPPEEKCRRIHDWLIQHVRYDGRAMAAPDSNLPAFDVRGVFLNGRAVCEGIAKAFMLLCQRAGVDCVMIQGTLYDGRQNRNMIHAWNIVRIGERFAHVDVTADLGMSTAAGRVRYDYYLIPDAWIRIDHGYEDTPPCPVCGLSWFERSGNCVSGTGELKKLVREQLAGGRRVLCFKALGKMPPNIADHIHSTVEALAAHMMPGGYFMRMVPNAEQKVFYIEFETERG